MITMYFYLTYHFSVILFPKFLRRKAGLYLLQEKANLHQTRWMIIQKRSSEQWLKRISQLVRNNVVVHYLMLSFMHEKSNLRRMRVVSLHWSTVFLPVQLHGNRFTVLENFNCTVPFKLHVYSYFEKGCR